MSKQEHMISTLKQQFRTISDLVSELEKRESTSSEDYAFVESQISQIIKGLKTARRTASSEMFAKMISRNWTALHELAA